LDVVKLKLKGAVVSVHGRGGRLGMRRVDRREGILNGVVGEWVVV
jgi:hypothetical protein